METSRIVIAGIVALIAATIILGAVFLLGGLFPKGDNSGDNSSLSNLPVVSISDTPTPAFSFGRNVTSTPSPTAVPVVTRENPTVTPVVDIGTSTDNISSPNLKTYMGEGFSLEYPISWGLLTCANSVHFELDPTNSQNIPGVVCDRAVKPVTVLVKSKGTLSCSGDLVTIGQSRVTRSRKTFSDGDIDYRWCLDTTNKSLDITHRVAKDGSRATSTQDYSSAVEEMITTIQ